MNYGRNILKMHNKYKILDKLLLLTERVSYSPLDNTQDLNWCKKLRAEINDLNGLYQNARYLQNKRFLTIIEREKEMISNEANNYRPVATENRLPFESL